MKEAFIQVRNLRKTYVKGGLFTTRRMVKAVDGVTLEIHKGETLGLVGESGSGKTTLGKILAGLERPDSGEVLVGGVKLEEYLRRNRVKIQLIFQNPDTSLDPRQKVFDVIAEALEAIGRKPTMSEVSKILVDVGLTPEIAHRYPHELSGGQKQRVAIARAVSVEPEFIIADEITSALDATIRVRILRLIKRLQVEHGFSMLFISHDLPVTASVSDNVAVMYGGKIVEYGPSRKVLFTPAHPYTAHLVASVPRLYFSNLWSPPKLTLADEGGDIEEGFKGCKLYPRCPRAIIGVCDRKEPELTPVDGRLVACHNPLTPSFKEGVESRSSTEVLSR